MDKSSETRRGSVKPNGAVVTYSANMTESESRLLDLADERQALISRLRDLQSEIAQNQAHIVPLLMETMPDAFSINWKLISRRLQRDLW